jgi:hypothetical protein
MTGLSPDVVRAAPETHAAYEAKMTKIVDLMADGLAGGSNDDRRARAWALLSVLIGGLTMARAVKSSKGADEIAAAARDAAVRMAGKARGRSPDERKDITDH